MITAMIMRRVSLLSWERQRPRWLEIGEVKGGYFQQMPTGTSALPGRNQKPIFEQCGVKP